MTDGPDDEVDGLLESLMTDEGYREEQPTIPIDPEPLAFASKRPSPPAPAPPRPIDKLKMPRPGAPRIPRPENATAQPPSVNPAGPPRREPFPPAMSPAPSVARPLPKRPPPKGLPGGAGFEDSEIDAVLSPLSEPPPADGNEAQAKPTMRPPEAPSTMPPPPDARATMPPPSTFDAERADSWNPPTLQPTNAESLDELDAVEVAKTRGGDDGPPTRVSGAPEAAPRLETTSTVVDDSFFDEDGPSVQTSDATFEDWDDESVTSILATEADFMPSAPASRVSPAAAVEPSAKDVDGAVIEVHSEVSASHLEDDELVSDPSGADSELPAAAQLGDHRLIDAWVARAEWFEAEALATADVQGRARLLVAASELWAMAGNTARARDAAKRSAQAAPSLGLASRQARALAALEGDFKTVALALDAEARAAPTEAGRAHAAYVSAEVHRLALSDSQGAERRYDLLVRAAPDDPRPHLARLAAELGTQSSPKVKLPDVPALLPLRTAAAELVHLRTGAGVLETRSLAVLFDDARRALDAGDLASAGKALAELAEAPGIGDGALLLGAAFFAPGAETRPLAIAALSKLLARSPNPAIRRSLAARALEQGDAEAMTRALAEPEDGPRTFGPADRVALSALSGAPLADLAALAETLLGDAALGPLAAAAAAVGSAESTLPVGDPATRAALVLGRRLGAVSASEELKDAVHAMRAAAPDAPLGRILSLELDAAAGATSAVAAELARLSPPEQQAEGRLVAALIEEKSGRADAAKRHYTGALGTPATAEAAARALILPGDATASDLLATLASSLGEETTARQSLLLFEAAARASTEDASATEDFITRAYAASPELPFAARLGGDRARARGDVKALLEWLRKQREAARDPIARALDGVREALLIADDDPAAASLLVEEAIAVRPDDIALRELAERMSPVSMSDAGKWRERLADTAPEPRTKAWLLSEAALIYARQGAPEDARRAARAARATGGSEVATALAARLAPEGPKPEPEGLAELRAREHAALGGAADAPLEAVATELSTQEGAGEACAHARLAARLLVKHEPWEAARDLIGRAASLSPPSLWALRQKSANARAENDQAGILATDELLRERVARPLDVATLSLRAAEAATRLGQDDAAKTLLTKTLEIVPDHLVALDLRASVAIRSSDFRGAAEDLETLAGTCVIPEHQWDAWYRAGVLWLDSVTDADRGMSCLERAAAIDVAKQDVFDRLQLEYVRRGDRGKLASLLEARLEGTNSPEERVALEVTRGRALADVGDRDAARRALSAALEASPDHADALAAYADICAADGELQNAEASWIRLARVLTEPEKQATVYGKLAELYESGLPNPTRAEICYKEILKRKPNDVPATEALVRVYIRLGDAIKAVKLQTELVDQATATDDKRSRTLALSRVYDDAAKDKKSALAVLERARKAWPHDAQVLRAAAEYHERHGEVAALNVLLDRAAAEARRALAHGRFELAFFGILETAASVRHQEDAARVAGATFATLEGRQGAPVQGAGSGASSPDLDDLLAPDLLSPALRALLRGLPSVFDAAYPMDLKALKATPLPPSHAELAGEIRSVAESMGVKSLGLFVSPAVGAVFVPASSEPARLVMGQALLDTQDEEARYFAVVRALKMLQGAGAALTRIAPIDLWPATAALLAAVAKGYQPQGVDAGKLADAKKRIEAALPAQRPEELVTLALEVGGAIGNRASQLGQAVSSWASRTALLAVGSPDVALRGVALCLGQTDGPPSDAAERQKWVLRHPEARDLAVFSVSDAYAEARRRVGLATG